MGSEKIVMTLWVRWKKPIKPLIKLDPDDSENDQDTEGNAGDKGRPVIPVNPKPQEKDAFEKEEMNKSKPVVKKNKLIKWYDWLADYVPKPVKNAVSKAFLRVKNSILEVYDGV